MLKVLFAFYFLGLYWQIADTVHRTHMWIVVRDTFTAHNINIVALTMNNDDK